MIGERCFRVFAMVALSSMVQLTPAVTAAQVDSVRESVAARRPLASPDSRSAINLASTLASVEFTTDEAAATARVAMRSVSTRSGESVLSLILGGPLKKSQQQAAVYDETGLRNATNIGLGYTRALFTAGDGVRPEALSAVCMEHLQRKNCTYAELNERGRHDFVRVSRFRVPTAFGLSAQVGRAELAFVDPADPALAHKKLTRNASTVSMGISTGFLRTKTLLGLSYRYSRSHKPADAVQICRPIAGSTSTQCAQTPFGVPKEETTSMLSLEGRAFRSNAALTPKVSYDLRKTEWRLELPLYLFKADNGGFVGGVQATVVEGKSAIAYSLFIGRALGTQMW